MSMSWMESWISIWTNVIHGHTQTSPLHYTQGNMVYSVLCSNLTEILLSHRRWSPWRWPMWSLLILAVVPEALAAVKGMCGRLRGHLNRPSRSTMAYMGIWKWSCSQTPRNGSRVRLDLPDFDKSMWPQNGNSDSLRDDVAQRYVDDTALIEPSNLSWFVEVQKVRSNLSSTI